MSNIKLDNLTTIKADGLNVRTMWTKHHYVNAKGISGFFFNPGDTDYSETSEFCWGKVFTYRTPSMKPATMHIMASTGGNNTNYQRFRIWDNDIRQPANWSPNFSGLAEFSTNRGLQTVITTSSFDFEYQFNSPFISTTPLVNLCVLVRLLQQQF